MIQEIGSFSLFTFVFFLLSIGIAVFFVITVQNTLKAISPQNRTMKPATAWFLFIPVFNLIFAFILVSKLSKSLALHFTEYRIPYREGRPTYTFGLAWAILTVVNVLPVTGHITAVVYLIVFIMYWIKIADCKALILKYADENLPDNLPVAESKNV